MAHFKDFRTGLVQGFSGIPLRILSKLEVSLQGANGLPDPNNLTTFDLNANDKQGHRSQ